MNAVTNWNLIHRITHHLHNSHDVLGAMTDIKDPPVNKQGILPSFEGWIL